MTSTLEAILDAHGGLDYWRSLSSIDIEISAHGFLFRAKHVRPQRHIRLTINTRTPQVTLHDYPGPGQRTVLHGAQRVEIQDAYGAVLQTRANPRASFSHWRRSWHWDAMDFAYFSGYAAAPAGMTRPKATFPPGLPTHSPTQVLLFDQSGRLTRHDYTAEVVGSWAKAAHLCQDYRQFGGLLLPTRRRVYPAGPFTRPLPAPTLVAIDIHDAQPV